MFILAVQVATGAVGSHEYCVRTNFATQVPPIGSFFISEAGMLTLTFLYAISAPQQLSLSAVELNNLTQIHMAYFGRLTRQYV